MDDHPNPTPTATDADFQIADEVLKRLHQAPGTPKHDQMRQGYATFRASIGADRFDLLYGLRAPRDPIEELEVKCNLGEISEEELCEKGKAITLRPIDRRMFGAYHDYIVQRIVAYGELLRTIVQIATDERDPECWRRREVEVDGHVASLNQKSSLYKDELETVLTFLAELRVTASPDPVRCGKYSHSSAHRLASHITSIACEAWSGCKGIADRSRTDPAYLYSTNASRLFFDANLPNLPSANDLMALLELERAAALKSLRERETIPDEIQAPMGGASRSSTTNTNTKPIAAIPETPAAAPKRKPRMKREVAEPRIAEHLGRRPHDTAEEVSDEVGCSVGVVGESKWWKLNQMRLEIARSAGVDPIAIKLDEHVVNEAGAGVGKQQRDHRETAAATDDAIDARERELYARIGQYERDHKNATAEQTASAVGCTTAEVQQRQTVLDQLRAEQTDSELEDVDVLDDSTKRGSKRKWVEKRV